MNIFFLRILGCRALVPAAAWSLVCIHSSRLPAGCSGSARHCVQLSQVTPGAADRVNGTESEEAVQLPVRGLKTSAKSSTTVCSYLLALTDHSVKATLPQECHSCRGKRKAGSAHCELCTPLFGISLLPKTPISLLQNGSLQLYFILPDFSSSVLCTGYVDNQG